MADVDLAVGIGRAVVQHEFGAPRARVAQTLVNAASSQALTQAGSRLGRSPRIGKGVSGRLSGAVVGVLRRESVMADGQARGGLTKPKRRRMSCDRAGGRRRAVKFGRAWSGDVRPARAQPGRIREGPQRSSRPRCGMAAHQASSPSWAMRASSRSFVQQFHARQFTVASGPQGASQSRQWTSSSTRPASSTVGHGRGWPRLRVRREAVDLHGKDALGCRFVVRESAVQRPGSRCRPEARPNWRPACGRGRRGR